MIGLGLSIVQLAVRAGLGFARGSSLALDFTSGNRTLDPRITFSRTTNATVTGSNGLIQYAPHNLLTFSEQFDNAVWTKIGATVTANTTVAPDGTVTADTAVATASGGSVQRTAITFSVTGVYTLSVYAKKGSTNTFRFRFRNATATTDLASITFDVDAGTITQTGVGSGVITPVGDGWYRCSVTGTVATASNNHTVFIYPNNVSGAVDGDSVFIWGAQAELGSTATTYNPTTVKNLLGFTEHFDNAAWTKSNSFVQTNLLLHSQEFDNAYWDKPNATIAANTIIAPDGSLTGDKLVESAGSSAKFVLRNLGIPSGTHTFSVFAKKAEREFLMISFTLEFSVSVNLTTGEVVETTGSGAASSVTDVGNGWYRVSLTGTTTTLRNANIYVSQDGVFANRIYTGDGTSGIFIWGAQLVQGTTPGDYKATYAAAAAVGYTDIYGQPFAQKLVENTATGLHQLQLNTTPIAGTPQTLSVYAKAGERNWVNLYEDSGSEFASFDLATGVIGITGVTSTAAIAFMGNGWYRCSLTFTQVGTIGRNRIAVASGNSVINYTGDGTSGIYIFGAQLSDSASVDPYVYQPVAAPASTAYYGPRFDYDPVTLAPKGLLIEEQRTNLVLRSEEFDNAAWTKTQGSIVANTIIAPDGTLTGDKFVESSGTINPAINQILTDGSSAAVTVTVYAKAAERNFLFVAPTGGDAVVFNLLTGASGVTIGSLDSFSITPVGNGWYRCSATKTTTSRGARFGPKATNAFGTYTGDGTSGVFLWGAQLEAGAFATSYIPSVASQVTRAADNASMIGNNFARWYNVNEGTVFAESSSPSGFSRVQASINDGTNNNKVEAVLTSGNAYQLGVNVSGSAVGTATTSNTVAANVSAKTAGAYKVDDFAVCMNAGTVATDTSGALPIVSQLFIGQRTAGAVALNGTVKRIAYFNRRLADSELQGITA